jgi:hypothetical protein
LQQIFDEFLGGRVWWRRGFHPFWSTSRRGKNPVAETVGFFHISMAGDTNAFI